jgi:hypothetical protein
MKSIFRNVLGRKGGWSALLSCGLALFCGGCVSVKQSTDHPDFLAAKEGKFVFLVGAYVYDELSEPKQLREFPWVGFAPKTPGVGLSYFPDNPRDWIGKKKGPVRILDVIPAGTTFKVVQHRFENHPTMGIQNYFDIAVEGPLAEKWPLLNGFWLIRSRLEGISFRGEAVARKE